MSAISILAPDASCNNSSFDTTIQAAGATVAPDVGRAGVVLDFDGAGERFLSTAHARSLAAALQSIALFVDEEAGE